MTWTCELCEEPNNKDGAESCRACEHPRNFSANKRAKAGKPASNLPFGSFWTTVDNTMEVMSSPKSQAASTKVAAFDMDGTLIRTRSGAKFARDRKDWLWWHDDKVPVKLKQLHEQGYKVVIFSNQAGVENGKAQRSHLKGKIEDLQSALGFGLVAYFACANDRNRKPHPTMWNHFVAVQNENQTPTDAFYCGDAAGRTAAWNGDKKTKKDFSCSDRKFALNARVKFVTPEECFLDDAPTDKWSFGAEDPRELVKRHEKVPRKLVTPSPTQELLIMVGPVAGGKSTIARRLHGEAGYVRANNDEHGSKAKCLKICRQALSEGKSCVIDNTNPKAVTRAEYLAIAEQYGVKNTRCIFVDTPRDVCEHQNLVREFTQNVKRVPAVASHTFWKQLEKPTLSEGFTKVETIPFSPHFDNEQEREAFLMWA